MDWSKTNRDTGSKPPRDFILLYDAYKVQLCFLYVDMCLPLNTLHILKVTKKIQKETFFLMIISLSIVSETQLI